MLKKSLYIYIYNSTSIYSFIYSIYFVIVHPIYNPDLQYQHMPQNPSDPSYPLSYPGGGDKFAGHGGRRLNQRGGLS